MTPQETALVTTLLERLKATAGQPKDSEAEALIQRATADQPDSAYYLAKTVLIHDLSLHSAQNRIAELEKNLASAQTAPSPPTSFLDGLLDRTFLPATRSVESPPGEAAAPQSPALIAQSGNPLLPCPDPGIVRNMGTGDFLRTAATTAALITPRDESKA
jgi:uncharacterized protein